MLRIPENKWTTVQKMVVAVVPARCNVLGRQVRIDVVEEEGRTGDAFPGSSRASTLCCLSACSTHVSPSKAARDVRCGRAVIHSCLRPVSDLLTGGLHYHFIHNTLVGRGSLLAGHAIGPRGNS